MNINDVFDKEPSEKSEQKESPFVKFDRSNESNQFVRFQFCQEFDEISSEVSVSHWVDGLGKVHCNLHPIPNKETGKIFLWNGKSKGENKKPEHNCLFCEEKYAAQDEVKQRGGSQEEGTAAGKLHNRTQTANALVSWEIMEKKKNAKKPEVIKELSPGVLGLRFNDLFSDKGKGVYTTLRNFYELKGTIKDHWFTMNKKGEVTPDDPIKDSERHQENDIDLSEIYGKIKTYKEGVKLYKARKAEGDKAEPVEDNDDEVIPF